MLQVYNCIKISLSNPKLLLSVLLHTFHLITGNTELFHLVSFIYTERIITYFETYILKILFILNRIQVLISK